MARKWNTTKWENYKREKKKKENWKRKSKKYIKDIPIDTHTLKRMKLHHLITLSGIRNYRVVRSALLWILEKTWDLKQSLRYFPTLQFHTSSPLHFTDEKMRHKGVHWHSQGHILVKSAKVQALFCELFRNNSLKRKIATKHGYSFKLNSFNVQVKEYKVTYNH